MQVSYDAKAETMDELIEINNPHKSRCMKVLLLLCFLSSHIVMAQTTVVVDTIKQTSIAPYNKVCHLQITRDRQLIGKASFISTGFFIAPNIILTAGHNVHHPASSRITRVEIIPGKYNDQKPFGSLVIKGKDKCDNALKVHPKYKFSDRTRVNYDFGIIIIPQDVLVKYSGLSQEQVFTLDPALVLTKNDSIRLAGYPGGEYGGDWLIAQQGVCGEVFEKKFRHYFDTYTGNSGSPVWVERGGKRVVVGVHTFGDSEAGTATKMDTEAINLILKWIAQNP